MTVRKRVIVVSASLFTLALIAAGAVAIPAALSAREHAEAIVAERGKIDRQLAMRLRQRDLAAELASSRRAVAAFSRLAIHEGEELSFVNALERVRDAAGVEQTLTFDAGGAALSDWERMATVHIAIAGTYGQTLDYLRGLEDLPYLVEINEITTDSAGRGAGNGNVATAISASAYWQAASAPAFTRSAD